MGTPRVDTAQPNSGHVCIPSEVRTAHQHLKNSANLFFFSTAFLRWITSPSLVYGVCGTTSCVIPVPPTTASALGASSHIFLRDAANSVALSFSPLLYHLKEHKSSKICNSWGVQVSAECTPLTQALHCLGLCTGASRGIPSVKGRGRRWSQARGGVGKGWGDSSRSLAVPGKGEEY